MPASSRLVADDAGESACQRSPSQLHVSEVVPYAPKPPKSTTDFVAGSNAMSAPMRGHGASGISERVTRDGAGRVEVEADAERAGVDDPQALSATSAAATATTHRSRRAPCTIRSMT